MNEMTLQLADEIVETAKFLTGTTCDSDRAQALIFLREALAASQLENQELRERLGRAEKDAARLNWLQTQADSVIGYNEKDVRKAIDAALTTTAQGEPK